MRYPKQQRLQKTLMFEPPLRVSLPEAARQEAAAELAMSSGAALTAAHLARAAYVYIRQSSDVQVKTNVERQRLQYALSDHAKEPGFHAIEVIDEDLGISGAGVHRPGFDALLEAVCKGRVGLVLSIEASRLSRNGRGRHDLRALPRGPPGGRAHPLCRAAGGRTLHPMRSSDLRRRRALRPVRRARKLSQIAGAEECRRPPALCPPSRAGAVHRLRTALAGRRSLQAVRPPAV